MPVKEKSAAMQSTVRVLKSRATTPDTKVFIPEEAVARATSPEAIAAAGESPDWAAAVAASAAIEAPTRTVDPAGPWSRFYAVLRNDGRECNYPGKPPFAVVAKGSTGFAAVGQRPLGFFHKDSIAMEYAEDKYLESKKLVDRFFAEDKPLSPPPRRP